MSATCPTPRSATGCRCRSASHRLTGAPAAGPGPLEIVAAEPTGYVDHLTHEVQPGDALRGHGPLVERGGVAPAHRHLGGAVALRAPRLDPPGVDGLCGGLQPFVGEVGEIALRALRVRDPLG